MTYLIHILLVNYSLEWTSEYLPNISLQMQVLGDNPLQFKWFNGKTQARRVMNSAKNNAVGDFAYGVIHFNTQVHRNRGFRNARWRILLCKRCHRNCPPRYIPFRSRPFVRCPYGRKVHPADPPYHWESPNQRK